jgi:maleate isomerase
MYGWKARIGLIIPQDNAVIEPELYSITNQLKDITIHSTRLLTAEMSEMPENGIQTSSVFRSLGTDVNVYACAETAFLKGVDGNQYISNKIFEQTNKPAITAMSAMVEAIQFLNVKNITLVTPYTESRIAVISGFFERMGINVVRANNQNSKYYPIDPENQEKCNTQPYYTAYQMAREIDCNDSEAVIISATNIRTFEIINRLEQDLQKPVITTNQAIVWAILRKLGIKKNIPSLGKLLNTFH